MARFRLYQLFKAELFPVLYGFSDSTCYRPRRQTSPRQISSCLPKEKCETTQSRINPNISSRFESKNPCRIEHLVVLPRRLNGSGPSCAHPSEQNSTRKRQFFPPWSRKIEPRHFAQGLLKVPTRSAYAALRGGYVTDWGGHEKPRFGQTRTRVFPLVLNGPCSSTMCASEFARSLTGVSAGEPRLGRSTTGRLCGGGSIDPKTSFRMVDGLILETLTPYPHPGGVQSW